MKQKARFVSSLLLIVLFIAVCCRWQRKESYCSGGSSIPWNVVPRNFPCASKFQLKMANPARLQAWHPSIRSRHSYSASMSRSSATHGI